MQMDLSIPIINPGLRVALSRWSAAGA